MKKSLLLLATLMFCGCTTVAYDPGEFGEFLEQCPKPRIIGLKRHLTVPEYNAVRIGTTECWTAFEKCMVAISFEKNRKYEIFCANP